MSSSSTPPDRDTASGDAGRQTRKARRLTVDSLAAVQAGAGGERSRSSSPSLPLPITTNASKTKKQTKSARIGKDPLRVRWARFKQRLGTGSGISESLLDGGGESTDTSYSVRRQVREKDDGAEEGGDVDEVVVENDLLGENGSGTAPSEDGKGHGRARTPNHQSSGTEESMAGMIHRPEGFWESHVILTFLRWRMWPMITSFFTIRFHNNATEEAYRREAWFTSKSTALSCTMFFILNWVLVCAFGTKPFAQSDIIFIYGFGGFLSVPLLFFIAFEFPRLHSLLYQLYLFVCVWSWAYYSTIIMFSCHFYPRATTHCGSRDFLGLFYYAIGLPTIGLIALQMTRFTFCVGAAIMLILNFALIVPSHPTFVRYVIDMMLVYAFLLYHHYKRETMDRRLYSLRTELKIQFRATQKAQVNERKASDSKRRLTSYVFHEVRVPLNTALLALQNLEATGSIDMQQTVEWAALGGSLTMMSKVLNDVLDFNRLDSGRFSTVNQPYNFHQAIRAMLVPLRLAANARGLQLQINLDRDIDKVARIAASQASGMTPDSIEQDLRENADGDGIVVGDEMRLRQVVTNLASNACKFTSSGGQIKIVTKLIYPSSSPLPETPVPVVLPEPPIHAVIEHIEESKSMKEHHVNTDPPLDDTRTTALSTSGVAQHNDVNEKRAAAALEKIVVRIEVHDTGVGIKAKDLIDHKLFSPYVQTEIGKYQGGKGTGLGLALVRRIVKLSGGRLGVKSKLGEGSEFWVEMPLGVGSKALAGPGLKQNLLAVDGSEHSGGHHTMERVLDAENIDFWVPREDHYTALTINSENSPRPSLQEKFNVQADSALKTVMENRGLVQSTSSSTPPMPAILSLATAALTQQFTHSPALSGDTPSSTDVENVPTDAPEPNPPPARLDPSLSPSPSRHEGLKVLVVDDDPLTRKLMTRMLSRLGCIVEVAENGKIALDMIMRGQHEKSPQDNGSTHRNSTGLVSTKPDGDVPVVDVYNYDVIFLDNQMPVMSGLDTVTALRDINRTDLVVGVTGNALMSDQQEYLDAGADRVLTKPVLEQSLKAMLLVADQRRQTKTS
ncbi:hypothetical protein BD410DRAFT_901857 [Rickenella mellea]|uniref:histidine kinase n=1 Tax=Rickenella mellea TaxID=50990 RepID=A0A4Y7PNH3_9AGAM|nr:hypothetical protein BD410DRAFT_901857 [Rickenella mellea]